MSDLPPCPICGKPVYAFGHEPCEGITEEWVECTNHECDYAAMEFDHIREARPLPPHAESL